MNSTCRDCYRENSFCRTDSVNINIWRLYNLFTSANKSSYIDSFADRAGKASVFTKDLASALEA